MAFADAIGRDLTVVVHAVPVNVLIWGGGRNSPEHYAKRLKVRRVLQERFPNADVRFSEDSELQAAVQGFSDLRFHEQELWHLAACDICVVLDTTQGAGEEIAYFVNSLYSHKLLILTHEREKEKTGFPASLRLYKNQLFYNDTEYDSCNLVERVIVRVRQAALKKLANL